MALRLTFGIDPGMSGAIATLIDGEPGPILDMPTTHFADRGEVDGERIARFIREQRAKYPGAYVSACTERVGSVPMQGRKQGGSSMFKFGDGFGAVRTAFACTGVPMTRVMPVVWKREFGLLGTEKDAARILAIRRFPGMAEVLKRKKDIGRSDALLIALWHESVEMRGNLAA